MIRFLSLLALVPALVQAGDFVTNPSNVVFPDKKQGAACPYVLSDPTKCWRKDDANAVKGALIDLRDQTSGFLNATGYGAHAREEIGCNLAGTSWVGALGIYPCTDYNSTPAIQAALNAGAMAGRTVTGPPGTFNIVPATLVADESETSGTAIKAAFLMRSHMHIDWPGATLRIVDGISTDVAPQRMRLFFSNEVLSDISARHIALDMNGQNNPISPSRGSSVYNRWTQFHFGFSGTTGGVAARADDVILEDVTFLNGPGVSTIVMGQSNTPGTTLGRHWKVLHCKFRNNGLDSDDHSSVFGWAEDVLGYDNTFENDTMPSFGWAVAFEVHGARTRFIENRVRNYYQGVWVAPNLTSAVENVVLRGNHYGPLKGVAIDFYRASAAEMPVRKVLIDGETVELDDSATPITFKAAVQIASSYAVEDVTITNCQAVKTGTVKASTFLNVAPQGVAGQKHTRIISRGNTATGFTFGTAITTNSVNGVGYVEVADKYVDLTPAGGYTVPMGVSADYAVTASPIDHLVINGLSVVDTRATSLTQLGVRLSGTITKLTYGRNTYDRMVVAGYAESALTVTTREGDFGVISFTPTWNAGSAITVGNGSTLGRYLVENEAKVTVWAALTIGSTTALPGGNLQLVLPLASGVTGLRHMGQYRIYDASAGQFVYGPVEIDGTSSTATLQVSGGTFATNGAPVALAAGDEVAVQITYLR